jgi:trans-aconitate methyltransferase
MYIAVRYRKKRLEFLNERGYWLPLLECAARFSTPPTEGIPVHERMIPLLVAGAHAYLSWIHDSGLVPAMQELRAGLANLEQ